MILITVYWVVQKCAAADSQSGRVVERSQADFTKGFAIGSDGDATEGGKRENVYGAHREIGNEEEGQVPVSPFGRWPNPLAC